MMHIAHIHIYPFKVVMYRNLKFLILVGSPRRKQTKKTFLRHFMPNYQHFQFCLNLLKFAPGVKILCKKWRENTEIKTILCQQNHQF